MQSRIQEMARMKKERTSDHPYRCQQFQIFLTNFEGAIPIRRWNPKKTTVYLMNLKSDEIGCNCNCLNGENFHKVDNQVDCLANPFLW